MTFKVDFDSVIGWQSTFLDKRNDVSHSRYHLKIAKHIFFLPSISPIVLMMYLLETVILIAFFRLPQNLHLQIAFTKATS